MSAEDPTAPATDELQASFLSCLRAARGRPMSFEQLRALGFENPAMLCYELEAAGIPLSRVERRRGRGCPVAVGVSVAPEPLAPDPSRSRSWRRAATRLQDSLEPRLHRSRPPRIPAGPARGRGALVAAGALLVLFAAAGWIVALTEGGSGAPPARSPRRLAARSTRPSRHLAAGPTLSRRAGSASVPSSQQTAAGAIAAKAGSAPDTPPATSTAKAPAPPSNAQPPTGGTPAPGQAEGAASATQLQVAGHELLERGRYPAAIAHLRSAITASNGSVGDCATPSSEACLAYAYALYDLGRALWLSGDTQAAVVALEERLHIDNQRGAVQAELALVRRSGARHQAAAGGARFLHPTGSDDHSRRHPRRREGDRRSPHPGVAERLSRPAA